MRARGGFYAPRQTHQRQIGIPKGGSGMKFSCTCIHHPHPATARIEVAVYDPFCGLRLHRISGSTKYDSSDSFRR